MTKKPRPEKTPVGTLPAVGSVAEIELIERMARAGYECKAWSHERAWDRNSWAHEGWTMCARDMLNAMRAKP